MTGATPHRQMAFLATNRIEHIKIKRKQDLHIQYLTNYIYTVTHTHRRLLKKWKGTLGQEIFRTRVVDLWNGLNVSADSIADFKRKLRTLD